MFRGATKMSQLPAIDTYRVANLSGPNSLTLLEAGNQTYRINGAVLMVLLSTSNALLDTSQLDPINRAAIKEAIEQGYKSFPEGT